MKYKVLKTFCRQDGVNMRAGRLVEMTAKEADEFLKRDLLEKDDGKSEIEASPKEKKPSEKKEPLKVSTSVSVDKTIGDD